MRDYQKKRVYTWENNQAWMQKDGVYLTKDECRAIVNRLDKIIKPVFRVKLVFGTGRGPSRATHRKIYLKEEWGQSLGVLLHEYAHVVECGFKRTEDHHGRDFVSIFCCLLHVFHPMQPSFKELAQSCNDFGVNFKEFDYWMQKLKLSKRYKPFGAMRTESIVTTKKKRTSPKQRVDALIEMYPSISYEKDYSFWVYCDSIVDDPQYDPYYDEHYCDTWKEVEERVNHYVELINQQVGPHISKGQLLRNKYKMGYRW